MLGVVSLQRLDTPSERVVGRKVIMFLETNNSSPKEDLLLELFLSVSDGVEEFFGFFKVFDQNLEQGLEVENFDVVWMHETQEMHLLNKLLQWLAFLKGILNGGVRG